jgi:hypothetical protein
MMKKGNFAKLMQGLQGGRFPGGPGGLGGLGGLGGGLPPFR